MEDSYSSLLMLLEEDVVLPQGMLTSGLLLGYAFAEGSGQSVNDLGPSNYDLQLGSTTGVDTTDPTWGAKGLFFTRANGTYCVNAAVPDTSWMAVLTVYVVSRVDDGVDRNTWLAKSTGTGATDNPIIFRSAVAGNPAYLEIGRANAAGYINWNGPSVEYGVYHCYAVSCPSNILLEPTFYIDGVGTLGINGGGSTPTAGNATGTNQPVMVGKRIDNGGPVQGWISYLLVYARQHNAAEVAQNYAYIKGVMAARGTVLP